MKCFVLGVLTTIAVLVLAPLSEAEYYYSSGAQIPLRADTIKVVIRFDTLVPQAQVFQNVSRLQDVLPDSNVPNGFEAVSIRPGGDIYAFLDSLNSTSGISAAEPYFYLQDTVPLPVGDQFVVGFDSTVSENDVESLAASHGSEIVRTLVYQANTYVLRNADPQSQRLLDVANEFYGESGVLFSHPSFGIHPIKFSYRLFDYYNGSQAHLKKIIGSFNSASVWDFYGVSDTLVVAVIDDGVTSHEDLPAVRVLSGVDFSAEPYDNNPTPGGGEAHGMGCAGIIAAAQTADSVSGLSSSTGIVGMYPAVKILPVKIFYETDRVIVIADHRPKDAVHLLILPKTDYKNFQTTPPEILAELSETAKLVAEKLGLADHYRLVINNGYGQEVDHIHFHFLSNRGADRLKYLTL